jgi:hypothetical protein
VLNKNEVAMSNSREPDAQAEFERLRGYVCQVQELAKNNCAALFWRDDEGSLRNGTMTFVSTGKEILGITAGHVADECLQAYQANPNRQCQVGGAAFDPVSRLIARDKELDLATFRLSEPFVASALVSWASTVSWPPRAIRAGEIVLYGGFAARRRLEEEGSIDFYFANFIGRLQSASSERYGLVLNIGESQSTGAARIPEHADLGGWSGGPVYRIEENPLTYLELAGIIYEYSSEYEIAMAHPLTRIARDGLFKE